MDLYNLTGKVAVVTGASSGLGADAARAYARHGAKVALLARRKDKLASVVEEIKKAGGEAVAIATDVASEESVKAAVAEVVKAFGTIDILLNNAGIAIGGSVENMTLEDWNKAMSINVNGVFLMSKYVVPIMKAKKYGRIVNVASINAVAGDKVPDLVRHVYNASKNAVVGLTTGMGASLGVYNITVNAVGPGLFESEMTEGTLFKHEGFMNMYNAIVPLGRPGARGELNGPILFFSSDASSYVTGQFLLVDGGFSKV